jgi:hypothetical protein
MVPVEIKRRWISSERLRRRFANNNHKYSHFDEKKDEHE